MVATSFPEGFYELSYAKLKKEVNLTIFFF